MASAPLWVVFLGSALFFGAALYLSPGNRRWLNGAVGASLFFGAFMTVVVGVMRRRDQRAGGTRGVPDRVVIARALRTGEPPTDKALDQPLLGVLERRHRQLRWASRVNPWFFGGLGVVAAVDVATEHNAASVLYLGLYVVLLVYLRRTSVQGAARLDRLESAIRRRSNPIGEDHLG
jgi:hypothetical protein